MKAKLIKEIEDYTCIIRIWEYKSFFGKTEVYQTIHPKR